MTIRCTVCGDDFKAWSDREEVCAVCEALMPQKGREKKSGKAAVKTDGFAAYEAAAREAKKAGKWLFQRDCTNIAAFLEYGGMGVMNAVQLLDWLQQPAE